MRRIRWIHFSDLHLGSDSAVETRLMRDLLPEYLESLGTRFDYAFCTGDIREHSTPYSDAAVSAIKRICASAGVPIERLFVVPGNHDVDVTDAGRSELTAKLTDWNSDRYDPHIGSISTDDLDVLSRGKQEFSSFADELFEGVPGRAEHYHDMQHPHFLMTTDDLNILHLDTALTYGRRSSRDFVIGTALLLDVLEQLDRSKPTVLLTHYSFDFLSQKERNEVELLLGRYHVQLWFAGHEHENLIRRQRDVFWECQCGNMKLQKGARSCVLTGELDLDTGEGAVCVHAWFPECGWAKYPFARKLTRDDSIYPFSISLPGASAHTETPPELAAARKALLALEVAGGPFYRLDLRATILPDLACANRVFPNRICGPDLEGSEDAVGDLPLHAALRHLWEEKGKDPTTSCHGLILGDGGMGKSTMMFQECRTILDRENRAAVYLSLQALEGAGRGIKQSIMEALYGPNGDETKLYRLIADRHDHPDHPDLTVFIDGFNELSGPASQRYVAEIKDLARYAGLQMVISSRMDFLRDFGLVQFWMIQTCDLREDQIHDLFQDNESEWNDILAKKSLRILLRNPMMALLYASTCPIIDRNRDLEYLDWAIPVSNETDLLRNYYLAQVAVLLERNAPDPGCIFNCLALIRFVLPILGHRAERANVTTWSGANFDNALTAAVEEANAAIFGDAMPEQLKQVKRKYRLQIDRLDEEDLYQLMITELCLLRSGNGRVAFLHQIFRDYLAAVHLYRRLFERSDADELWHEEPISVGVAKYLRHMPERDPWAEGGLIAQLLSNYRGKTADDRDHLVANLIRCWLPLSSEPDAPAQDYDLSGLDLRKISLAETLKRPISGHIDIDGAIVSRGTFINDKHHDAIAAMAFSHDARTLAAVSRNGLVSVTNIMTQGQMIVGELELAGKVTIGFDAGDCLMLKDDRGTRVWPTISYDVIENAARDRAILKLDSIGRAAAEKIASLRTRLQESGLMGCISTASEDGRYLAVGFESGYIQVWETKTLECVARLSLSDSQILTASFTPDGGMAAIGSGKNLVQLWSVKSGRCIRTLCFERPISRVSFPVEAKALDCYYSDGNCARLDLETMKISSVQKPRTQQFVSAALLKTLNKRNLSYINIRSAPNGNAIVLDSRHEAYTWDESRKTLQFCPGHGSAVKVVAICETDGRFAASYSDERFYPNAKAAAKNRRAELMGQKIVRVRIVKTGQCQWRLPTKDRSIDRLQFYTTNRIVLAGFATNGDIILWELINRKVNGVEHGKWNSVEIVKNNQVRPLECAVPEDKQEFISAYANGSIVVRPFQNGSEGRQIQTFPGINASVLRWNTLQGDHMTIDILRCYKEQD